MIKLPSGIKMKQEPLEKRYKSVLAGLSRRIMDLYTALYDDYGEEGLELIRRVSKNYGEMVAEHAKKTVTENSLQDVAKYLIKIFNNVNGEGEVVEFSDKRVNIRVYRCPYAFKLPAMCEAHTAMEKAFVEGMGHRLMYYIPQSIPKGNEFCDHVIQLRDQ